MTARSASTRAVLIAGPTASGKSRLALELASREGGVIINADSMQVYRELDILTARPSRADEAAVPHRLYGHAAAADAYSAGRFVREAAAEIAAAHAAGRVPVIVGGTGLYFKALTDGLSPIAEIPPDVRAHWRGEAIRLGAAALHAELSRRDPQMAQRLRPSDPQRVTRALEVLEATGRSLADWQAIRGSAVVREWDCRRIVVAPPRDVLHRRSDARLDAMIAAGALEEVRRLMALDLDPGLPAMRAVGVRPLADHLAGRLGLEAAVAEAQRQTRSLAKRQMTWLRRNMMAWDWVEPQ